MKTLVVGLSANGFVSEVMRLLRPACRPEGLVLAQVGPDGPLEPSAGDCECLVLLDELDTGESGAVYVVELDVPSPPGCGVDENVSARWRSLVAALPSRPDRTYGVACRAAGGEPGGRAETAAVLIGSLVEEED